MKVSVIIPCYNVEMYISDCIKSVEQQTYKDIEVLCVNDGSDDQTATVIENLISASPLNIELINQENKGAPNARNSGISQSKGDYIQFLDADDLLGPNKIKAQIDLAIETHFPDLIVGSYQRENMKGDILKQRVYNQNERENIWLNLMRTDLGNTCSNLFKSNTFHKGLCWNESLESSQEYDLMFQILKRKINIVFDPQINTTIRLRESGSISKSNIKAKWERYVQLRANILDYLSESMPSVINNDIIENFFTCIRMLYPHNPEKAVLFYKKYIPKDFVPSITGATGKSYSFLYKFIGFKNTEKLRLQVSKSKAS